jgi:TonB family protein
MTAILVEAFWKSAIVLGIALLANLALRKKSADVRRLILSSAIVTLFIAALATALLPRWNTELPIAPATAAISIVAQPIVIEATAKTASGPAAPAPHRQIPNPIPILWLAGAVLLLTKFLLALRGLRRLRTSSTHMREINGIPILRSEIIAAPVTWGILRPVILVPDTFDQLPQENRDAILAHEIGHIQSHDFLLRTVAEIARALLWFQPLIWIARRRLRQEQELACDDRVLESGANPSAYAKLLLNWNTLPDTQTATALGMTHGSCLKQRICALLDQSTRRARVSSKALLLACPLVLAAAIPLAAITFSEAIPNPLVITLRTPVPPSMEPLAQPTPPRMQLAQNQPARPATAAPATPAITIPSSDLGTSTLLVITDVVVTDKTTRTIIAGLGVNDFTLTEDGVQQAIRFCEFFHLDNAAPAGSYYALGYYTTNTNADAHYRVLKVRLKDQSLAANATLDFRPGYYGEKAPPNFAAVTPTDNGRFHGEFGTATTLPPGVTPPVLTYRIDPEYSDEARKAKYSGTIDLSVLVDETGKVAAVNVVHALGMGLDEKAMEAVRQWRFDPATQNGKPIAAQVPLSVNFRLL